jgi:hypothetical protein
MSSLSPPHPLYRGREEKDILKEEVEEASVVRVEED